MAASVWLFSPAVDEKLALITIWSGEEEMGEQHLVVAQPRRPLSRPPCSPGVVVVDDDAASSQPGIPRAEVDAAPAPAPLGCSLAFDAPMVDSNIIHKSWK